MSTVQVSEAPTAAELIELGRWELRRRQRLADALAGKAKTEIHRRKISQGLTVAHAERKAKLAKEAQELG